MKLIITILLIVSIQAQAESKKKKPSITVDIKGLVKDIQEMGELIGEAYDKAASKYIQPEIINCSKDNEQIIIESLKNANSNTAQTNAMKAEIFKYLKDNFTVNISKETEKKFYKKMACINRKLTKDRISYSCSNSRTCRNNNYAAYVEGSDYIMGALFDSANISICKKWVNSSLFKNQTNKRKISQMSSTIIHEVAHTCMTEDHKYHHHLSDNVFSYKDWYKNADAYATIINNYEHIVNE